MVAAIGQRKLYFDGAVLHGRRQDSWLAGPGPTYRSARPSRPGASHDVGVTQIGERAGKVPEVFDPHVWMAVATLPGKSAPDVLSPGQPGPTGLGVDGRQDLVRKISNQDVGHVTPADIP